MQENCSFKKLVDTNVRVKITDIGASPITSNELPPYMALLRSGNADIVGFEPHAKALDALNLAKGPHETYLPHAVADGNRHTLHSCMAAGMTSLLKPNPEVLKLFHGFPMWGTVLSTEEIDTVRFDDVEETAGTDMIKIDIQGGELMVLKNSQNRLKDVLVIHTEVEFLPMYQDQPLFSDVDSFLRSKGFMFHRFFPLVSRTIIPMVVNGNIYEGFSQLFWADAVFIRDVSRLDLFSDSELMKTAMLLHECYNSLDLAHYLLVEYDRRTAAGVAPRYLSSIMAPPVSPKSA